MNYSINDLVIGKVTSIKPYALFMSFDDGSTGLLHISEISDNYIKDIEKYGSIGDEIRVKILTIDEKDHFLRVSLKQVPEEERYSTHETSKKSVLNINKNDFETLQRMLPKWIENALNKKKEKTMLDLNLSKAVELKELEGYKAKVSEINSWINNKTAAGNDFLGWANWPVEYDKQEVEAMIKSAAYVRDHFDILVVCGIGGSYLGARAAYEAVKGLYNDDKLEIIFMGQTFSPNYVAHVLKYLEGKNFAINVISKSGTTTETSISFRLLKELLEKQVGKEKAQKAIYATTDKEKGALKTLCNKEGYQTFVLPGDIGGRFSVLTAVGLFPLACAGLDIKALLSGAAKAREAFNNDDLLNNDCYKYACLRDYMYRNNKAVEMFVTYEPSMSMFSEWCKQLFGESEGKEHKGLLPDSVTFSTDLHSLGQFIQEGSPVLFETIINVKNPSADIKIPHDDEDLDGLNYLEGKNLAFVNQKAYEGTLKAHTDGGVPCAVITLEEMNEENLGYLFYFFMRACAMSAYLLDINPFNQPGVEVYKKNMFHLLGKKGY